MNEFTGHFLVFMSTPALLVIKVVFLTGLSVAPGWGTL